jgi:hypothetical protein
LLKHALGIQVRDVTPQEVLQGIARHFAGLGVHIDEVTARIAQNDSVHGVFHQLAVLPFTGPEGLLHGPRIDGLGGGWDRRLEFQGNLHDVL